MDWPSVHPAGPRAGPVCPFPTIPTVNAHPSVLLERGTADLIAALEERIFHHLLKANLGPGISSSKSEPHGRLAGSTFPLRQALIAHTSFTHPALTLGALDLAPRNYSVSGLRSSSSSCGWKLREFATLCSTWRIRAISSAGVALIGPVTEAQLWSALGLAGESLCVIGSFQQPVKRSGAGVGFRFLGKKVSSISSGDSSASHQPPKGFIRLHDPY